jgi:hypothetical protein
MVCWGVFLHLLGCSIDLHFFQKSGHTPPKRRTDRTNALQPAWILGFFVPLGLKKRNNVLVQNDFERPNYHWVDSEFNFDSVELHF